MLKKVSDGNPYAKAFRTVGELEEQAKQMSGGEIPLIQIVLLTDRQLNADAFKNVGDNVIFRRVEAPTCEQVAVVWIQEDGHPPEVKGCFLHNKGGRIHEIRPGMPQLDPCCFPLLHPRGTQGYRWFLPKNKPVNSKDPRTEQQQQTMENVLQTFEAADSDDVHQSPLEDVVLGEVEDLERQLIQLENGDEDEEEQENEEDALEAVGNGIETDEPADELLNEGNPYADVDEPQQVGDANAEDQDPLHQFQEPANPNKPRSSISARQFYRYRMAMRTPSKEAFHWLWFARRLAEFYVISVLNRVEREEMNFVKEQQAKKNLRHILARDYIAALEKGLQKQHGQDARLGAVFLIPKSLPGSRPYFQEKYANLLTICRRLGNPTWFLTFTGNPCWPELISALQEGQSYAHRADIVCRIFISKATELIRQIVEKNALGKVAGWTFSVEHQKRGMPHIHMLIILRKSARVESSDLVDQYVSARIPPLPDMNDLSPAANQQRRLWYHVTSFMLHDCNKSCLDDYGKCKKHFPKPYSDMTELSDVKYTNYARLPPEQVQAFQNVGVSLTGDVGEPSDGEEDHLLPDTDPERANELRYKRTAPPGRVPDRQYEKCGLTHKVQRRGSAVKQILTDANVVSYNPYLLLMFGSHINIEYCFGQKSAKYIFKYILKGFEKGFVEVSRGGNNVYNYDEIKATFKCRFMTSMEAYLRLHSFPVVQMSHQIYTLGVHDENGQTLVLEEGHEEQGKDKLTKMTPMLGFFELCKNDEQARKLTYDRLPYFYYWDRPNSRWKFRITHVEEDPEKAKMFVRIYTVSPKRRELFALRALLMNKPGPTSFEDLRTVDGVTFPTYTEAAQKFGLFESDDLFVAMMEDACAEISSDRRLQRYFAMMLVHSRPSNHVALFEQFLDAMNPPKASNDPRFPPKSVEIRRIEILKNLEYFFRTMGASCDEFGLRGLPADYDPEEHARRLEAIELIEDFYGNNVDKLNRKSPQKYVLELIDQLNADQRKAFDEIAASMVGDTDGKCFFVEGSGGCGKTFLYNVIIRWLLAGKPTQLTADLVQELKRGSVIAAASTGIAALLLIGGGTIHRQFSIPNWIDENTVPMIGLHTKKAEALRNAELILIDEVSMVNQTILSYLDRMLKDVCYSDQPFGGKTIVLGGDFQQLCPVVQHGVREDQVKASIKSSPLFSDNFKTLSLTINMRTSPNEQRLRFWLGNIGSGTHQLADGVVKNNWLEVPEELVANSLEESIDFCFPPHLFTDPLKYANEISQNAILCPRNLGVQMINDMAMQRLPGETVELVSIDKPLDPDDTFGQFRSDSNLETIHNELPSGCPPHILRLKVGAPVMLIRNLDVSKGLCNGTRMQVLKISEHNVQCRIVTGPRASEDSFLLPKIRFEYGREPNYRGVKFERLQFPIRPCFSMTINKSQGQTLGRLALILTGKQCFSHGQVYVALSRVRSFDSIRVFSPYTVKDGKTYIANVVFHELLDRNFVAPLPQFINLDFEVGVTEDEDLAPYEIGQYYD